MIGRAGERQRTLVFLTDYTLDRCRRAFNWPLRGNAWHCSVEISASTLRTDKKRIYERLGNPVGFGWFIRFVFEELMIVAVR